MAQEHQHEVEGMQWRPVAHTARAWTAAEKGYSQIEKESNALLTSMISNRMYLLGIPFMAVVDHKPLLPLYNAQEAQADEGGQAQDEVDGFRLQGDPHEQ